MTRVRAQVELDRDEVSPVSLMRAQEFLLENLEVQAEQSFSPPKAINWETYQIYTRRKKETVQVVAWAKVIK